MPPENKFTTEEKKGILTLWTQTLSISLRWKYVLLLGRFSLDSNVTVHQTNLCQIYLCYCTIDAHSVFVFSICILIWFEILSVVALLLPFKSVLLKWNRPSSGTCISVKLALRGFEKKKKKGKENSIVDSYKNNLNTFSTEVEQISCT